MLAALNYLKISSQTFFLSNDFRSFSVVDWICKLLSLNLTLFYYTIYGENDAIIKTFITFFVIWLVDESISSFLVMVANEI